jgi:hypothetical protein
VPFDQGLKLSAEQREAFKRRHRRHGHVTTEPTKIIIQRGLLSGVFKIGSLFSTRESGLYIVWGA